MEEVGHSYSNLRCTRVDEFQHEFVPERCYSSEEEGIPCHRASGENRVDNLSFVLRFWMRAVGSLVGRFWQMACAPDIALPRQYLINTMRLTPNIATIVVCRGLGGLSSAGGLVTLGKISQL